MRVTPHTEILAGLGALRVLRRLRFVSDGSLLKQVDALEESLLAELERLESSAHDTTMALLREELRRLKPD